jgi:phage shock protein PspC (stress-responsive transcriptional regulator)
MNKTIIININGIVFHIEEDAYEILKNYMTDVKRHFSNSADSLEITTDIENRVAEMFNELLANENKQVIVEQDVHTVIEQMGRVEDFENLDDETASTGTQYAYDTGTRRLFRDPDDHLISGVCAGIADYFDIQPLWIRLAFALSFFFAGSGLLLYIILWIVIPQATTRADRMAMKGQKLNLQGFKDNLEEELSSVRNHLNNLHQEARPTIYKMRDFIGDLLMHLNLFFKGAGKILIKIIGFAVLLACFGAAIFLIVILILVMGFHIMPQGMPALNMITSEHNDAIYIAAFLTAFLPVITIILAIIAALFNTRSIGKSVATTLVVIWGCSLIVLIYSAVNIARNFRSSGKISQIINLKTTPDNVYYLKLNDIKHLTHEDSLRLNVNGHFKNMIIENDDNDDDESNSVNINIIKSDVDHPVLTETIIAQGYDETDALINARNTNYIFTQQDSVLSFDNKLRRADNTPWRDQHLDITLQIPLNAKVIIDQELNNHINMDGISVGDCKNINKQNNATSATFIMMDNGLQCKVDTLVTVKTKAQIDSARRMENAKTIARLQAQIDSARIADSVQKKK